MMYTCIIYAFGTTYIVSAREAIGHKQAEHETAQTV